MADPKIDGVTTRPATDADNATFTVAKKQLSNFAVPQLYDSSDTNIHVIMTLFGG